jgi:hypothetical protein
MYDPAGQWLQRYAGFPARAFDSHSTFLANGAAAATAFATRTTHSVSRTNFCAAIFSAIAHIYLDYRGSLQCICTHRRGWCGGNVASPPC